ncbi:hypothetical protein AB4305_33570 [Nocardia sp. 2YAB30]|uniref:hypothetical protein n=1 Tax=Nocardia sp. 2YAB30 TaxID=3233022 RepID=UPI003F9A7953
MNAVQRALAVGIAAAVLQAVMLIAFVWPASNTKARDLPVAVAGAQAAMIADHLAQRRPGSFEFITVADAAAARDAIADLEVYGAIVTEGGSGGVGAQVLIASAASPAAAQQLTQIAQQLSGAPAVLVEDVVASDPDDLGGRGFAAMVLPLVMSSLAAGYLLALVVSSIGARMAGLAVYAVAAGLLGMTIIQGWLSLIPGSFLVLAGVVGLISFSVSGAIVALGTVAGRTGLGIGGLTFLLLGNPLSAAATGPEMLPKPWGSVGQLLPPGAGASLLRSVSYFGGAGTAGPLTALLVWATTALALLVASAFRARQPSPDLPPALVSA